MGYIVGLGSETVCQCWPAARSADLLSGATLLWGKPFYLRFLLTLELLCLLCAEVTNRRAFPTVSKEASIVGQKL